MGLRRLAVALLTLVAVLLAAFAAFVAFAMVTPLAWDGPGRLGALALTFPLHLLAGTALAAVLWPAARALGAVLGARLFAFSAVLTLCMALVPTLAIWTKARALGVPLSLGEYAANARHLNAGPPQKQRTLVYGKTANGETLELDVWPTGRGDSGPLRPAMVLVHGGAWSFGHRSASPEWDRWLNGLGFEVFDAAYRLPPPARWQDEVGDVKSALGWVAAHAAEYHLDPARISVMGSSAGANLALLAAYSRGDAALPPSTDVPLVAVHSVVSFYGPSDLARFYRDCPSAAYLRPLIEAYVGGAPDALPDRYRVLSPLAHVSADSPPTVSFLGGSDRLVAPAQVEALDAALARAGVAHETVLLPAQDHGFDVFWGGFGTQLARAKLQAFLRSH